MRATKRHRVGSAMAGFALYMLFVTPLVAQNAPSIGESDLGGVVTGPASPEAGVWVIAETTDLPTKFVKIVVTDDQGRYLIPDLPKAGYSVWVRGYGLVDSPKVQSGPGKILNLAAVKAPSAAAAAEYYPAVYWWSMLGVPDNNNFPGTGTGPNGNGIAETVRQRGQWLDLIKSDGCLSCHQTGNKATRTIAKELGAFDSSYAAWVRRIQSGQGGFDMVRTANRLGAQPLMQTFADWSDRIAAGQLPKSQPPRPQGAERNIVISMWDWATPTSYIDDQGSADRRNPTFNAFGPIFGVPEVSSDFIPVLDPLHHTKSFIKMPLRDPKTPTSKDGPILAPSPNWGMEPIWDSQASMRHAMFDEKGRVWITSIIRPADNPAFCKAGSDHPSAKLVPIEKSERQLAMYDLKTGKFTLIDTCFTTHHMYYDANGVLWFSAGVRSEAAGWFDTKIFDATGDEQKAQGWTAIVLDTNGNGKRDDFVGPSEPVDPAKDKRVIAGFYGIAVSPADGSVWGTVLGFPGAVVRIVPGADAPTTALSEYYELPWKAPEAAGYSPRGIDVDSNGVVWISMISGHLGSFDRRQCKGPLNGPAATGSQCPEGWTLYPFPAPQFEGLSDNGSAEGGYWTFVDRSDTFGLGRDVPINTGNNSDALFALVDGKFVTLRVPYPMGYYAKAVDGRIDDPHAGWKGRGLWSGFSGRAVQHIEGGKGTTSKVVHFQIRPDPLAR